MNREERNAAHLNHWQKTGRSSVWMILAAIVFTGQSCAFSSVPACAEAETRQETSNPRSSAPALIPVVSEQPGYSRRKEVKQKFVQPETPRTDPTIDADVAALRAFFPDCAEDYVNDCMDGEIRIPCTNLCWYRCNAGETWRDGACHGPSEARGIPLYSLNHARYQCETTQIHGVTPGYRLPTLAEISRLLWGCAAFIQRGRDWYCASERGEKTDGRVAVNRGVLGNVVLLRKWCIEYGGNGRPPSGCRHYFSVWLNEEGGRDEIFEYGYILSNGGGVQLSKLRSVDGPGSALANGTCVREK